MINVTFDVPNIRDMTFADGKFVVVGQGVRNGVNHAVLLKPTP